MQKFLVCPAIGGAAITFGAAKFLVRHCGEGIDPAWQYMNENPGLRVTESHGQVGYVGRDIYSPLLTEWWRLFRMSRAKASGSFTFGDNVCDKSELTFLWGDYAGIRDMLLPFVERLDGDYATFDQLNNNTPLRIVEVPDGYYCGISEDPETGCEFVEEHSMIWHARFDEEYAAIAKVRRFCAHDASTADWYEDGHVYDLDGVSLVLSGVYGAARLSTREDGAKYMFLKRNEYYRATPEHPWKCAFEINDLHESKFRLSRTFTDAGDAVAYARLVTLLEDACRGK